MRINVYNEELTEEVEVVTVTPRPGRRFIGLRFLLESSPKLHHTPDDDDRSAVTLWTGDAGKTRQLLRGALKALDEHERSQVVTVNYEERGRGANAMALSAPIPLTLDDIRSVDAFRDRMIEKLAENTHKGNRAGWLPPRFTTDEAVERLFDELIELQRVVRQGAPAERIIREAADIGNFAMMVADQTGELRA